MRATVATAAWPAARHGAGRRRRRGRARRAAAGRHRDPPVPLRPGPAPGAAGRRAARRARRGRHRRARAADPVAGPARRRRRRTSPPPPRSRSPAACRSPSTPAARSTSRPSGPGWRRTAAAAEKEAAQCRAKLGNEAFVGKAPERGRQQDQGPAGHGRGRPGADRRCPGGACRVSDRDAEFRRGGRRAGGARLHPHGLRPAARSRSCSTCSAARSGRTRRSI